jgi:hypothetical protein
MAPMTRAGVYGKRLGDKLHVERAPFLLRRMPCHTEMAVTEFRHDNPKSLDSDHIPKEDAFPTALQSRDICERPHWKDGKQSPTRTPSVGRTTLYDPKRGPAYLPNSAFHSIHFYLPRAVFNEVADDAGAPCIGDLNRQPGAGYSDETMKHLGSALRAAPALPEPATLLEGDR